jgi:predicted DNA-binding protein
MTNISLQITQEMKERLDEEKERSGVPISEIIRRAISAYLK